jgi:hypothetical protein
MNEVFRELRFKGHVDDIKSSKRDPERAMTSQGKRRTTGKR